VKRGFILPLRAIISLPNERYFAITKLPFYFYIRRPQIKAASLSELK